MNQHNGYYDLPFYIHEFLLYIKRNHYSPDTHKAYTRDLKVFEQFIHFRFKGTILTKDIIRHDLVSYMTFLLEQKGYKLSSIQRHLSTLKSFYKFLVYEMDFEDNVASKIRHKKVYTPLPEILNPEEVEVLLEAAKPSVFYYTLFAVIYYTGSRITPVIQLLKKNITLDEKKLYFPRVKGGRDLYLPISDKLLPILQAYLSNHPYPDSQYVFSSPLDVEKHIDADTVRVKLRKVKNQGELKEKRVTPHILRHSMATKLTLDNVPQRTITEILGHVDMRSAYRYQQLNVENIREHLNKL